MSILSFEFLGLVGLSSILLWLFCHEKIRPYALMLCNIAFLYLLKPAPLHLYYLGGLVLYTWLLGYLLNKKPSKWLMAAAAAVPAIGLCYFKYSGYFTGTNLLMPLGLSFYTFKAISYLADVFAGKSDCADPVLIFDYICFFPAFSAGPIHRAQPFFEQLKEPFSFDYADQKNGCIQAGFGLFEKLVIADALSGYVSAFLSPELSGWYTIFGVILYSFQIYADFDAYSNTAIGAARMMGFHLDRNFHTPYLASSLREFWRRWHISLSSWLRDYIYIPLGGSRKGLIRKWLNTLVIFLVSGLWHGSTLMFVIWGLLHGIISVIEDMIRIKVFKDNDFLRGVFFIPGILLNFLIVSVLWIFFRSASYAEAVTVIRSCLTLNSSLLAFNCTLAGITNTELIWIFIMLGIIIVTDILRNKWDMMNLLSRSPFIVRWAIYTAVMVIAVIFGVYGPGYNPQDFIYVTF